MLAASLFSRLCLLVLLLCTANTTAQQCDPWTTPVFAGRVPTPRSVLGFDLGDRQASIAEVYRMMDTIAAAAPDRVLRTGSAATSVQGRPLQYAIMSAPGTDVERVRQHAEELIRGPSPERAREIARTSKAVVWIAASVHGDEVSGCDAALRVMYELSDRTDCAAQQILRELVLVILPSQNPDGRNAFTRRNAHGFDMNRDWFAQTQPESVGKVQLVAQWPGVVFVDAHEMTVEQYFFPPNADPYYHELSATTVSWINNLYGGALAAEFRRRGIPFFTGDIFDSFYLGYGDSFPASSCHSAAMTFEQWRNGPYPTKTLNQFVTQWVTISTAATNKEDILYRYYESFAEARRQGELGQLQPNRVYNPGNVVRFPVPDQTIRQYFLVPEADKQAELQRVTSLLRLMNVRIDQLAAAVRVADFRRIGRAATSTVLPAGTLVVSLNQSRKHFLHGMLAENTYVPFPYFYDTTGWAAPIRENLYAGCSGAPLAEDAELSEYVPPQQLAPAFTTQSRIVILRPNGTAGESFDWALFTVRQQWGLTVRVMAPSEFAQIEWIASTDVLLVPSINVNNVMADLGTAGRAAITQFVQQGGRYVGWNNGAALAARIGISTNVFTSASSRCPGAFFRAMVVSGSALELTRGVGSEVFMFYVTGTVMRAGNSATRVVNFPGPSSTDWFVSGYEEGTREDVAYSAAVTSEDRGRVVLFATEVNFRSFTFGSAKMLQNALAWTRPPPQSSAAVALSGSEAEYAFAEEAARNLTIVSYTAPIRLFHVGDPSAAEVARIKIAGLLRSFQETARFDIVSSEVRLEQFMVIVDNPERYSADQHPAMPKLAAELRALGFQPHFEA